jgi:hypothetical protein
LTRTSPTLSLSEANVGHFKRALAVNLSVSFRRAEIAGRDHDPP